MYHRIEQDLNKSTGATTSPALLSQKHQAAILDAEVRRLARTLDHYGVLTCRQLEELCGARHWTRGRYGRALELAQERNLIRDLGLGFYAPVADAGGEPQHSTGNPGDTPRARDEDVRA